ncbi:PAS domain S-box protein [bacterium]|nr:PAS domain S-box protein [bacterium]
MDENKDKEPLRGAEDEGRIRDLSSLLQTKNFFNSVLKSATEYAITVCDFDGVVQFWNSGAEKLTGYSSWDVIGVKNIKEFYPDEFTKGSKIEAAWQKTLQKGKFTLETNIIKKTGKTVPISLTITPLYDRYNNLIGTVGISRDITEQYKLKRKLEGYTKRLETMVENRTKELKETTKSLVSIIEKATDGIIVHTNGIIDSINPATAKISGYSSKELVQKNVLDYLPYEEDRKLVLSKMQERIEGKDVKEPYYVRIKRKDGSLMEAQITAGMISQKPPKFVTIIRDITEESRLKREKEEIKQQLWQTGKLAALGELAAGVAHEINNPLMGILGYAQVTMDKLGKKSTEYKNMQAIMEETDRISQILKNLFVFASQQKQEYSKTDIADVLNTSLSLMKFQLEKDKIDVSIDIKPGLPPIIARKSQLQEVFINMLTNAQYSLNKKFKGRSKNKMVKISADKIEDKSGKWIKIEFYDYGTGISESCIEKIYAPFFSTKKEGEGIGLGLSISKGIVDNHKGLIEVESKEGKYTKFIIKLPITE